MITEAEATRMSAYVIGLNSDTTNNIRKYAPMTGSTILTFELTSVCIGFTF